DGQGTRRRDGPRARRGPRHRPHGARRARRVAQDPALVLAAPHRARGRAPDHHRPRRHRRDARRSRAARDRTRRERRRRARRDRARPRRRARRRAARRGRRPPVDTGRRDAVVTREVLRHDVTTPRGREHVREVVAGGDVLATVLLVHGNCSSSAFFDPLLRALPADVRGVAVDLRGYGDAEVRPVDATRGVRDFADDVLAVLDALDLGRPLVAVAHSAGAGVVLQLASDLPDLFDAILLEAPMSPYGFGGTRDVDGTPLSPDVAGSGGGTANPAFVAALAAGDRSEDAGSPRDVLRRFYVADPASLG